MIDRAVRDIFFWLLWEECSNIGRNNDRAAGQKNGRLSGLCERTYNERHHIKYYYKCTDSFVPAILVFCDPVCDGTFFYLFAYHNETGGRGIRGAFSVWWQYFRGNAFFRKLFFLTFYTTMILFRTLLNRDKWMNPLSDVMANWWIWKYGEDGTRYLTTECIENLMLFIPFTILLFWTAGKKILKKTTFLNIVWTGLKITFVFSLSIELLQLFLRLGTFQVSDLTYNTLGGGIGGAVYWIGHQLSVRRGAE